ncbi:hypothetical protein I546_7116 [Mycobacterium kansasii 732]|nr:hypothetical protein I546_7116 [Mycobacterium kansasii 732]
MAVVGGHDSSVISRYSAYSANQEITTVARISMISKNSTTWMSLSGISLAGRQAILTSTS